MTKQIPPPLLSTPIQSNNRKKKKAAENFHNNNHRDEESQRKSARLANKPKTHLTIEQQAIALLIKRSGVLMTEDEPEASAHTKFGAQFVQPLSAKTLKNLRSAFGMEGAAGGDYDALAVEADA